MLEGTVICRSEAEIEAETCVYINDNYKQRKTKTKQVDHVFREVASGGDVAQGRERDAR